MHLRLYNFLQKQNILYRLSISWCWEGYSTSLALIELRDTLYPHLDQREKSYWYVL